MFGYHMGVANGLPDGYTSAQTKVSINTVLTEGSDLNTTFKSRMDKVAAQLQSVQTGNGVVIFRPFHEAGGTWFWWSMEGGPQYVRLWKYMFNYMTTTKGLKNLLWLLPYDGSPDPSFYPGKQYVDIGGADNYNKAIFQHLDVAVPRAGQHDNRIEKGVQQLVRHYARRNAQS